LNCWSEADLLIHMHDNYLFLRAQPRSYILGTTIRFLSILSHDTQRGVSNGDYRRVVFGGVGVAVPPGGRGVSGRPVLAVNSRGHTIKGAVHISGVPQR